MADNSNALEPGEVLEIKVIDYRDGTGEWANCKKCGAGVFRPKAISSDNPRIVCASCGAVAVECAVFAVRLRRLPDVSVGIDTMAASLKPAPEPAPSYPYLRALLCDAENVRVTWAFDEQQADAIHKRWTWEKASEELHRLLTR